MSAVPLTDRGRRTRDALINAARGVFEERGYDGTRMGDIAEAAGVSHGTVYTWFATKDAVLMAVVDSLVDGLYASLSTPDDADPVSRIERANRSYLDAYRAHARLLEVVEQAATTDESFRAVLAGLRAAHVDRVAATLRHLQADGLARADLDSHVAAAALCAMVEGFARHWFGRGEAHDEDVAVRTLTTLWAASLGLATPMRRN
ncbi:MAG: TetR/AcrR family transcriptional regulator [Candidatus Nanopelagicales bacterium]